MQLAEYFIEGGIAVVIIALIWRMTDRYEKKLGQHALNTDTKIDNKTTLVFKRFDDYKRLSDERMQRHELHTEQKIASGAFVSKDLCELMNKANDQKMDSLEEKMAQGFQALDQKIDLLLKRNVQ